MFFQCDLNHQIVFGNGTLEQLPQLMSNMGKNVFLTTGRSAKQRAYWPPHGTAKRFSGASF